jgi:hypothetical protein
MDPALLLDFLYLKLANEFRGGKAVSAFSAGRTAATLERVRTSDGSLAQWVAESTSSPDPALAKFATMTLFDPLSLEDEDALLAKFAANTHDKVRAWREKMIPKQLPVLEVKVKARRFVRSKFRRMLH